MSLTWPDSVLGDLNCAHSFLSWIYSKHWTSSGLKSPCFLERGKVIARVSISFMNSITVNLKLNCIKMQCKRETIRRIGAYCSNQVLRLIFSVYLAQTKGRKHDRGYSDWVKWAGEKGAGRAHSKLSSLVSLRTWVNYFTFLSLEFLIYTMERMIASSKCCEG